MRRAETSALRRAPHKAKPHANTTDAQDAWWYENTGSIDVYIEMNGKVLACRIDRFRIEQWLSRVRSR